MEQQKIEYCLPLVVVYPNGQSATFFYQQLSTQHRKNEVSEMIENKNEVSKDLEKALQALEQASTRFSIVKRRMLKASLPNEWSYELAEEVMRDYVQRKQEGLARFTKKGELQSRIDRKNEEIDILKIGLSGIAKRYGYQNVPEFQHIINNKIYFLE